MPKANIKQIYQFHSHQNSLNILKKEGKLQSLQNFESVYYRHIHCFSSTQEVTTWQ